MSRIGNMPVVIPSGVTATIEKDTVQLKGPKGEASVALPYGITVVQENGSLVVSNKRKDKPGKALFGLIRALLANHVTGITTGFTKTLELVGVGYRANLTGVNLNLSVGFSHPVVITPPKGITFAVNEGKIVVSGTDRQLVGQIAANIRAVKPPEPYKGKGIRYSGEYVRKKAGKSAKAVGGK
jgi:large subunit ribosomal protein L6